MTELRFGQVIFTDDKVEKIVPLCSIRKNKKDAKPISPKHVLDFDDKHVYYVRWYHCGIKGSKCDKTHTHEYNTYKANLFHLGESQYEVQRKSNEEPKRKRFKKKMSLNSSASDSTLSMKISKKKKSAKALKKGVTAPKTKDILNKYQSQQFLAQRQSLSVPVNVIAPRYSVTSNGAVLSQLLYCNDCNFQCDSKSEMILHMERSHTESLNQMQTQNDGFCQSHSGNNSSIEEFSPGRSTPKDNSPSFNCDYTPQRSSFSRPRTASQSRERAPPCRQSPQNPNSSRSASRSRETSDASRGRVPSFRQLNRRRQDVHRLPEIQQTADEYSDEEQNPIINRRAENVRENTPDPVDDIENNRTRRTNRFGNRRIARAAPTNKDYGYGVEIVGKENKKYSRYISLYRPQILRDMKKFREIRGLSPEGQDLRLFDKVNGQYYIGCGVFFDIEAWNDIARKDDREFLNDVVHIFWNAETISNRCLLENKVNNIIPSEEPYPVVPATPAKLNNYFRIYRRYLVGRKVAETKWQARMKIATEVWTKISSGLRSIALDRYYREQDEQDNAVNV